MRVERDERTASNGSNRRLIRAFLRKAAPYLVVVVAVAFILPPILWMAKTSVTAEIDTISFPPQILPTDPVVDNYTNVLGSKAPRFFLNTVVIALGAIVVSFAVGIPAAYAGSRLRFRGREFALTLILVASYIPFVSILVALYSVAVRFSLIDSYPVLIVVYAGVITGQVVWFVRSYMENVPYEIEEAAVIDGATRRQFLQLILLPLIAPGLAAVSIFVFVFVWNDFLIGAFLTQSLEMQTVQLGLVRYAETGFGTVWGQYMAYALLGFVPILVLFVVAQKKFIAGLTSGATKG